jgi:hypothetical protein
VHWCGAPIDALMMLKIKQDRWRDLCKNSSRPKLDKNQGRRLTASEGRYTPNALGHSRL